MPKLPNSKTNPDRLARRMSARLRLVGAIIKEFQRQKKAGKITNRQAADALGISRQAVHKILTGPGNWQLDTIGDLLWVLDRDLPSEIHLPRPGNPITSNYIPEAIRRFNGERSIRVGQTSSTDTITDWNKNNPTTQLRAPARPNAEWRQVST